MTKTTSTKTGRTQSSDAVAFASQRLPGEIVYSLHTHFGDWWAGKRDARLLKAMLGKNSVLTPTPWMHGLAQGFLMAAVKDRKLITAEQKDLQERAARLVEEYRVIDESLGGLKAQADKTGQAPQATAEATTPAEQRDSETQRLLRRQRAATQRTHDAQAQVSGAQRRLNEIATELAGLRKDWEFFESMHWSTEEALRDYYEKRQDVYVRSGLRGCANDGTPPQAPEIVLPEWKGEPLPALDGLSRSSAPGSAV